MKAEGPKEKQKPDNKPATVTPKPATKTEPPKPEMKPVTPPKPE
jgi:hypothetical protein